MGTRTPTQVRTHAAKQVVRLVSADENNWLNVVLSNSGISSLRPIPRRLLRPLVWFDRCPLPLAQEREVSKRVPAAADKPQATQQPAGAAEATLQPAADGEQAAGGSDM